MEHLQHYPRVCFYPSAASLKCRGFPCPFVSRSGFQRDGNWAWEQEDFVNDGLPGAQSASKINPFPTLCLQQPVLLTNLWHCFVLSCPLSSLGDAASEDYLTCRTWTAGSPEYCGRSVPCSSVRVSLRTLVCATKQEMEPSQQPQSNRREIPWVKSRLAALTEKNLGV